MQFACRSYSPCDKRSVLAQALVEADSPSEALGAFTEVFGNMVGPIRQCLPVTYLKPIKSDIIVRNGKVLLDCPTLYDGMTVA